MKTTLNLEQLLIKISSLYKTISIALVKIKEPQPEEFLIFLNLILYLHRSSEMKNALNKMG